MNKLMTLLLAAALTTSTAAYATDAAKPAATPAAHPAATPAATSAPATHAADVKGPAIGEAVTPQNDAAAMHEIIAKMHADDKAKKASAKK